MPADPECATASQEGEDDDDGAGRHQHNLGHLVVDAIVFAEEVAVVVVVLGQGVDAVAKGDQACQLQQISARGLFRLLCF